MLKSDEPGTGIFKHEKYLINPVLAYWPVLYCHNGIRNDKCK